MTRMMKDDLHQAIEALEEAANVLTWPGFAKGALALRRVLEGIESVEHVPENECGNMEPLAWMYQGIRHDGTTHGPHLVWMPQHMDAMSAEKGAKAVPLYAAPCDQQATVKDFLQVAQKEREACAALAESQSCFCCWGDEGQQMAAHIADVIRGRRR